MSIADDIKILEELIKDPNVRIGKKAKYKNKSYSLAELNDLLEKAKEQEKQEKIAAAEGQPVDRAAKSAADKAADALQNLQALEPLQTAPDNFGSWSTQYQNHQPGWTWASV